MFDASKERIDIVPIWLRILGLLMEFWTQKSFT